ncbi:hypothetical protein Sipo8835_33110 [Streptomyces ipomoeae]|jgi:hypothetical protein|uniref:Tat pathway signal sequence domain protein n=2 Tax=Streptomyces ipomoeae TaxID=103232 RepID=L1L6C2_9ACTN|nr:hypothetical protein [Streptomyces ipomoeae]EKX68245.1 hypothetical protein STRIP9103_06053 [Streptomyces ipomoeae 91-03]MDX2693413.1 hypothetical protein [Streptomyces ipomoeae]MDX2820940.1 hypothetical protein [Streptomyces ipomoeae]MDX2839046.1 hypothetical protein [Streptomyces ipomoeae]MDX2873501.1 hypothetical protein [Streptomyces ipomoeae]
MKFRKSMLASMVAAGVALTLGTAGTASASSYYSVPGGQVKFTSKGEILKVWDTKAGKTGLYVSVYDLSAKNPTMDWCNVKGKGKSKTCDMKFKNGHKLEINVFSYTKLNDHSTRKLVAGWKDKA